VECSCEHCNEPLGNSRVDAQLAQGDWRRGFNSHQETVPQHFHTALTAVATVHIGKITEYVSYLWVFPERFAVGKKKLPLSTYHGLAINLYALLPINYVCHMFQSYFLASLCKSL
jgi:hypothetical protein